MTLAAPAWLLLVLPWAALVVLALRAYRPKVVVSFLRLWPREEVAPDKRRGWQPPPAALVLLLIAVLMAIIALASPRWASATPRLNGCTIIVDDGVTMLAGDRFATAGKAALEALTPLLAPDATARIITAREQKVLGKSQLAVEAFSQPTASDVHPTLRAKLNAISDDLPRPIILVSDLGEVGDDVFTARPTGTVDNVGLVSAAVANGRCTFTARNDSDRDVAWVGGAGARQRITLPKQGTTAEYDIEVQSPFIALKLDVDDQLADDNMRWVGQVWPRLSVGEGATEVVQRFAQAYGNAKPAVAISPTVTIGTTPLPEQCVIVPATGEPTGTQWPATWPDHPLLDHVRLPQRVLLGKTELPAGEWQVLLEHIGRPLLAVDEVNHRAYIGFLPEPTDDAVGEYLVLLTNAVEFCADGSFQTSGPRVLARDWQRIAPSEQVDTPSGLRAGLYARGEEKLAIHVPSPVLTEFGREANDDLRRRLAAHAQVASETNIAPWLLTGAIFCLMSAILLIRHRTRGVSRAGMRH